MKKDLLLLTISDLLFFGAESLLALFGIIFFYNKFNSVFLAVAPFILVHITQALVLPVGGKFVFKFGLKQSLIFSTFLYIIATLLIVLTNGSYTFEVLCLWSLLIGIANMCHYVPVIYILGSQTQHSNRGKIFSLRRILFITGTVTLPLIGGLISDNFGFNGLLITCIGLYLLYNIPIIYLSKIEATPPKSLFSTLTTMRGKRIMLYKISEVFSNNIGTYWPLYVFIVLAGSFSEVGILFALVSLITIVLTYLTGKALDKTPRIKLYSLASFTNFIAWIARALSFNYITVLIADVGFKLNHEFKAQIIEVVEYDLMNDHVNNARASIIILRETLVNYLIAFVLFVGALSITLWGFQVTFIIFGFLGFIFTQLMRFFLKRK